MAGTDLKALAPRWVDAINNGDWAALANIVDVEFVDHQPLPGQAAGLSGLRQAYELLRAAFPDWHVAVEHVLAEGDTVAVRSVWRGTHNGELFTIPPTGTAFTAPAVDLFRVADGKLAEHWGGVDLFSILQQLAVVPPLGASGGSTRLD